MPWFSVTGPNNFSTTLTTDSNGSACLDSLPKGAYTVTETKAPAHYKIDDATGHAVNVPGSAATCTDKVYAGALIGFTDSPLTDLDITVASQDTGAGGSNSTITCTDDGDSSSIGNSPQGAANSVEVKATDLPPGDYTCKVNIDP